MQHQFKILIVGDNQVGKSAWLKRHSTGEYLKEYKHTPACLIVNLQFATNYGDITLEMWDCPSNTPLESYQGAHGVIVMYDRTNLASLNNVEKWINKVNLQVPICVCGNKNDKKENRIESTQIYTKKRTISNTTPNTSWFHISARSNYNFEKPIIYLCRQITGHLDLELVEAVAINIPEIDMRLLNDPNFDMIRYILYIQSKINVSF